MLRDSSATTVNPGDPTRARKDRVMSRPKSAKNRLDFSMTLDIKRNCRVQIVVLCRVELFPVQHDLQKGLWDHLFRFTRDSFDGPGDRFEVSA